jgi:hypothetical protein
VLFSQSFSVKPTTNLEVTYPLDQTAASYPTEHYFVHNTGATAFNLAYTVLYSNLDQLNWIASSCCFFLNQGSSMQVAIISPNDSLDFTVQLVDAQSSGTGEIKVLLHEDGDTTNGVVIDYKVHVVDNIGINELNTSKYSVYPNPTSDFLTLKNIEPKGSIEIFDASGKLHYKSSSKKTIDVTVLENGVYFLHLNNPDESQIIRFVKE